MILIILGRFEDDYMNYQINGFEWLNIGEENEDYKFGDGRFVGCVYIDIQERFKIVRFYC